LTCLSQEEADLTLTRSSGEQVSAPDLIIWRVGSLATRSVGTEHKFVDTKSSSASAEPKFADTESTDVAIDLTSVAINLTSVAAVLLIFNNQQY
jgi:hypothetical protein